ncbi:MAG: glycosyltransferase [Oscillospiraceae bacterium]|nr:glycosyltransferase [Oscillospiraceae bacterium]
MIKYINKLIYRVTDRLKPMLFLVLPKSLLRKAKSKISSKSAASIKAAPYKAGVFDSGVNLYGYFSMGFGLGQGVRLVSGALKTAGIDYGTVDYGKGVLQDQPPAYNTNIIHINPDRFYDACLKLGDRFKDRYNIGFWLWELPEIPTDWVPFLSCVHEIWTPSRFTQNAFARSSPVPVRLMPYGIEIITEKRYGRDYFNLPADTFLYLCMYDVSSTSMRKNPMGTIDAFKKSFPPECRDVGIVVKINCPNQKERKKEIQQIKNALKGYSNLFIIEEHLSKTGIYSLIEVCDVFVSMHRSEGFGLVMAEAMYLGTPAIATNWSANTDFMTNENSCPVDYKLTGITKTCNLYQKGQLWAEPDTSHCAEYMRRLFEDRDYYNDIKSAARNYIKTELTPAKSGTAMTARLKDIGLL